LVSLKYINSDFLEAKNQVSMIFLLKSIEELKKKWYVLWHLSDNWIWIHYFNDFKFQVYWILFSKTNKIIKMMYL